MQRCAFDLKGLDAVVAGRLHEGGYEKAGEWDLGDVCRQTH